LNYHFSADGQKNDNEFQKHLKDLCRTAITDSPKSMCQWL